MKKTITALFILISTLSFAQLDWSVKSIDKPVDLYTNASGTTDLVAQITFENKGDTIPTGDTLIFNIIGVRTSDNLILFNSPTFQIIAANDIAKDQTVQTNDISLNIPAGNTGTENLEIALTVVSFHRNRTNPIEDVDSTNNLLQRSMFWKPASRASVSNLTYSNNIAAYPNPANTELNISLNYTEQGSIDIKLINLEGQVVIDNSNTNMLINSNTLDVSALEQGIYMLRVRNGDAIYTRKVTIAH